MQRRSAAFSARGRLLGALAAALLVVVALLVATTGRGHGEGTLDTAGSPTSTFRATSTSAPVVETTTTAVTDTTVAAIVTDTTAGASAPTTPTTRRTPSTTHVTTPAATPVTVPSTASVTCNTSSAGSAGQLAARFCAFRAGQGLPAMRRTSALDAVAQEWANHIAAIHDLVHRGDMQSRVLGACSKCTGWAENIAYAMDVDTIWNGWLNSKVHYENITNGRAGEFGFGVAKSADGYLFAVQNFGRYPA